MKDSETVTGSPLDCEAGIETGRRRFSCASDPHSDSIRDSRTVSAFPLISHLPSELRFRMILCLNSIRKSYPVTATTTRPSCDSISFRIVIIPVAFPPILTTRPRVKRFAFGTSSRACIENCPTLKALHS